MIDLSNFAANLAQKEDAVTKYACLAQSAWLSTEQIKTVTCLQAKSDFCLSANT